MTYRFGRDYGTTRDKGSPAWANARALARQQAAAARKALAPPNPDKSGA